MVKAKWTDKITNWIIMKRPGEKGFGITKIRDHYNILQSTTDFEGIF